MKKVTLSLVLIVCGLLLGQLQAQASSNSSSGGSAECGTVSFGQPPWPGVKLKTATAAWILKDLGYHTKIRYAQLGLTYGAMARGDIDVTLSQWFPSARAMFRPFGIKGTLDIVSPNLTGGTYTIAVPAYVYKAGVTSIRDLNKHKARFGGKIYGIGEGTTGDNTIKRMIHDNYADLGDWQMVPSSVSGMLAEVKRKIAHHQWIAFLGWSPHPMNINFNLRYLSGGQKYWGSKGNVIVETVVKKGYAWQCPNVGQFLDNYKWTPHQQSLGMKYIINNGMKPLAAGKKIIRQYPQLLTEWLVHSGIYQTGGVFTADGKHRAEPLIAAKLGIKSQ